MLIAHSRPGICAFESLESRSLLSTGGIYVPPASPEIATVEDPGWKFQLNPPGAPQSGTLDDSSWTTVTLPYTWNEVDALANSPATGNGWYRKTINMSPAMLNKELYLQFEGGDLVTSLYIDGTQIDLNPATAAIDSHQGGYQTFDFDVTAALNAAVPAGQSGHVVAVEVNNQANANIAPSGGGGYTYFGGLYRDVTILALNPTHVAVTQTVSHSGLIGTDVPSQIAGPGVTFSNSAVVMGATSAQITVQTVLDNLSTSHQNLSVTSYLVDATGVIQTQSTTNQAMNAGQTGLAISQIATVNNPHLWDGRIDPYLYSLYVEVSNTDSGVLLDLQKQQVGIRSFQVNAVPNPNSADPLNRAPFILNGLPYRVVGVDMHQDTGRLDPNTGQPAGYAQSAAQIRADIDLVVNMGCTAIRTSHYQDNQAFYTYCDQLGLLVDTEAPIKTGAANDSFTINAEDQYNELIRQNINHPSVFAWGFGNEVDNSSGTLFNVFTQFETIAHTLDPHRVTILGDYGGSGPSYNTDGSPKNLDAIADILDTHLYTYWYVTNGTNPGISQNAKQPQGTAEYGGGGSAYQYADTFTLPVASETGGVTTRFHPQNQLEQIEERQYTDLTKLSYLWGMFTWQMFDNASPGQSQGDANGLNDKGLVTRDRVPKDSYYFYQAALNDPTRTWDNQRVLKIGDQFWTVHNAAAATVTVFSNIGAPTLSLNGVSLGTMSPLSVGSTGVIADTYTMNITLATGVNQIQVNRTYGDGQGYSDSTSWSYYGGVSGTTVARIDFAPTGQAAVSGYTADNGAAYGTKNGQSYGWLPASGNANASGSVLAVGSTFGTATTAATSNGINLNYNPTYKTSSVWEYALPNGVYDVMIGAGQSGTSDGVNNFAIEGKTATIDTNGNSTQDTFYTRVYVSDGKLTLTVASGGVNARITYIKINSVTQTALPTVSGVTVNGGAQQRSFIQSLALTFSQNVTVPNDAFTLSLRGGATYPLLAANPSGDGATYVLTLANGANLTTLPDGVYDLTVDPTKVTGAAGVMAAAYTFTFHRLFGDLNGDRTVDASEMTLFSLARDSKAADSNYNALFDYDQDGDIDAIDLLRFNQHLGKTLMYQMPVTNLSSRRLQSRSSGKIGAAAPR